MRDSLSRMPTRLCPNGERTTTRSSTKASDEAGQGEVVEGHGAGEGPRQPEAGRGTLEMPLSPWVSVTQRWASPHTTMPSARVIMRKYTPVARSASKPKIAGDRDREGDPDRQRHPEVRRRAAW